MGKMLLFLVVGMGALFSVSTMNMQQSNFRTTDNASAQWETTMAKNLARSGVEVAIMELAKDTAWTSGYSSAGIGGGSLEVSVAGTTSKYPGGPSAGVMTARLITSTGRVNGQTSTVQTIITIPKKESVPPAMRYAVLAGAELQLVGNVGVYDDNNPKINANIHTNTNLQLTGNNTVQGYGTYAQEATVKKPASFQPTVPNGGPLYYRSGVVDLPSFDPAQYKSIATDVYPCGLTLSGNTTLGTKEKPKIIYVKGSLQLSGNITGYAAFIIEGNVKINGNVSITTIDPTSNNLGIYCSGDVDMNGNVKVIGAQIMTKGNIHFGGNNKIYGNCIAGGEIAFNGNVDIYYRAPNTDLTKQFWPGEPGRPIIISYLE